MSVVDFTPPSSRPDVSEGALEPYIRALRARWPLVLVVTLTALAGAIGWLALRTPDYQATANILIKPVSADDPSFDGTDVLRWDPTESTRTVQTAASLIENPQAAELAAEKLGEGWDRARVQSSIEVEPQGESNILSITALAEGADLSARLANEYAAAALETRSARVKEQATAELERLREQEAQSLGGEAAAQLAERTDRLNAAAANGDPTLSISQAAVPPGGPVGVPSWVVLALALLGGFTLGTGEALVMEVLDRRIRDEDELRRLYSLPVLAQVPAIARRQRRSLGSPASTPPQVREAFRTLQVQLDRTVQPPRVVALTSASTGDAKTTSAVNLAIALVGAGHRVIIIDFDLRKPDVGRLLNTRPKQRLSSLLTPGVRLEDLLVEAHQVPTLKLLAAHDHNDAVLLEPLSRRLPELFEEARAIADYVIVDTPPLGEVSDALRLLDFVDDLVIVARPGHTNRANLELMRDQLLRAGRTPTGFLLIGENPGRSNSYYAYGMAMRDQGGKRSLTARSAER